MGTCENTVGSFMCSCPKGMSLDKTGKICQGMQTVFQMFVV